MPIKYKCDGCDAGCVVEVSSEKYKPVECPSYDVYFEKWQLVEDAPSDKAVEAMRKIRAVINGRGDSVTKVLKCKDILAYMGI